MSKADYEKLRAVWYKKLEQSGFEDIEQDEDNLKVWSSRYARKSYVRTIPARVAYREAAEDFLRDYKFESELDKVIWEYHVEAVSIRDMSATLNKALGIKTTRNSVHKTIKRLKAAMRNMYSLPKDFDNE